MQKLPVVLRGVNFEAELTDGALNGLENLCGGDAQQGGAIRCGDEVEFS